MSIYLMLPLLFSWCSFVVGNPKCPTEEITSVTVKQYKDWDCGRLCVKDDKLKNAEMINICEGFEDPGLPDAYNVKQIQQESGCKLAWVALTDNEDSQKKELQFLWIGICHISPTKSVCVSGAEKNDDMLVWKRIRTPKEGFKDGITACHPHFKVIDAFAASVKKYDGSGSSSSSKPSKPSN